MIEGAKVVTAAEMQRIEKKSIEEGASAEEYMLMAGRNVARMVHNFVEERDLQKNVILVVGKGNNGGDAWVAGLTLLEMGYQVQALYLYPLESCSELNQKYGKLFLTEEREAFLFGKTEPLFTDSHVIIDGILGTGFSGEVKGDLMEVIVKINQAPSYVASIDVPSGLNASTGEVKGAAVIADMTLYLGMPKLGFFLEEGANYTGSLKGVDFGLDEKYCEDVQAACRLVDGEELSNHLPPIIPNRHKYDAGYVLALAGSQGMPGAAVLSSLAALRSGAGIVRLFHGPNMEVDLSSAPYEIIRSFWNEDDVLHEAERASSLLVGPGLGKEEATKAHICKLMKQLDLPTVIDADGLNILKDELENLSQDLILTPHHGEMLRLLGMSHFPHGQMLYLCQELSERFSVTLVLKGAPTFIFHPGTPPLVISRGSPGMATAGAGDVLTGIIAALLAQGLLPRVAAALGVYLHGLAGEIAAEEKTAYGEIASDIIEALPEAIITLLNTLD